MATSAVVCLLAGCGVGAVETSQSGTMGVAGRVMGGQFPVANAHIYLYQPGLSGTGTTANGSAATSMQNFAVTTDAGGNFNLSGAYTCVSNNAQAYIVAVGGNPGLPVVGGITPYNAASVMMTALGRCGDLYTTQFVAINELTTVAAAWALQPFYKSYDHIGASSTNAAGMANAFANAALLVDPHTGENPNIGTGRVVETGKISALANAIASCVNSDGTGCGNLFTAATTPSGTVPTNTLDAAINVVRYPGNNVGAVYMAQGSFPPFPSTLTQAPNDWTMSLTVSGGGLSEPAGIGVDASNYVWAVDYTGTLTEFSGQGVAQSATGYSIGYNETHGLAIGPTGNVWVTVAENPYHYPTVGEVIEFYGSGNAHPGTAYTQFGDYTINYPQSVAVDTDNSVYVNNYYGGSATKFVAFVGSTGGFGSGSSSFPVAVALDTAHGVWLANSSDQTVTHVASDGTILAHPTCCDGANGLAIDASGNAWVANYYGQSISEVGPTGTVLINQSTNGGVGFPEGVAVDAAQDVYFANYFGNSITKIAGNSNAAYTAGTGLSPSTGFGRDAKLGSPAELAIDNSGDLWVSNYGKNTLVEFLGLSAPTAVPRIVTPQAP